MIGSLKVLHSEHEELQPIISRSKNLNQTVTEEFVMAASPLPSSFLVCPSQMTVLRLLAGELNVRPCFSHWELGAPVKN